MKISVDNDKCQGHTQCAMVDPDLFTLDDDGYCNIGVGKPVPSGMEEVAQDGVDACPEMALSIDED